MRVLIALAAGVFLTAGLYGDSVQLRNGQRVDGTLLSAGRTSIRFQNERGRISTYNRSEVEAVYFGSQNSSQARNNNGRQYYGNAERSNTYRPGNTSRNAQGEMLPAGTVISVRTIDAINSDSAHSGESYHASVSQPVVVNGRTVIPQGADATLRVVQVEQGGRISGNEQISLELESVRWNGGYLTPNSTNAELSNGSRGKESAAVIGGGAALGAVIGAIAGGGKGAAIGAASGAGAGTAVQVIRGQQVKIDPETEINFTVSSDTNVR